jgi:hypothetical protein
MGKSLRGIPVKKWYINTSRDILEEKGCYFFPQICRKGRTQSFFSE